MNILGIGTVFSGGTGIARFESSLQKGWVKPPEVDAKWAAGGKHPVYRVDLDAAPDKTLLKKIRRADRLSKMAVLGAAEALKDGGIGDLRNVSLGVIVATAFGAHVTTFSFLDNILDYGDAAVSPTTFSNSVHNAAASYVSESLTIKGPTLTITQFRFSFQTALQLAGTWLDQRRCEYVLVGAVDQYGDVLGYVSNHKLTTAVDGKIKPFAFKPTCQVPGEGAAFFLLGRERAEPPYCSAQVSAIGEDAGQLPSADIAIIDADGMLADESAYLASLPSEVPVAAYSPLFGSMMSGSAFNIAAGALMLKRRTHFAAPVQDNPHGLRLLTDAVSPRLGSIRCIGYDCYGKRAVVRLARG